MTRVARNFWAPVPAGILLGLVLLLTFVITGHGLGASGFFTRLAAAVTGWAAPEFAAANSYLAPYLRGATLDSWITWEAVGLAAGALAGSLWNGRFRVMIERGAGTPVGTRLAFAFVGGLLVGFGSRLARGCTSGLGLSGGATLSVAAFVFLIAFFAAGFAAMVFMKRYWQ